MVLRESEHLLVVQHGILVSEKYGQGIQYLEVAAWGIKASAALPSAEGRNEGSLTPAGLRGIAGRRQELRD